MTKNGQIRPPRSTFEWTLNLLGFDFYRPLCLRFLPRYLADRQKFKKAGGTITHTLPVLGDFRAPAGGGRGHYFHQDLLVAGFIHRANPKRHIDVGSRVDGFVAHVASFRPIEVLDIRPLPDTGYENIIFSQCDFMNPGSAYINACESISCLHALEHFGLGRYGDPIDPDGHLKGFANLVKMLRVGGTLYISFPIGKKAVFFNAHRVFDPAEPLFWAKDELDLTRFDYVDDLGNLHRNRSVTDVPGLNDGCGIYTFRKR